MKFHRIVRHGLLASAAALALGGGAAQAAPGNGKGAGQDIAIAKIENNGAANAGANSNSANSARTVASGVFFATGPLNVGTSSYLRLTNAGNTAGAATVTIYDGLTGANLATYTSASVAPNASLRIDLAEVTGAATPTLTAVQAAGALTMAVRAGFRGSLQTLALDGSTLSNTTSCSQLVANPITIGGVAGPGALDFNGVLRLVNGGTQARTVTLTIHDAADGTELGTWTSASIPAHSALTVTGTALAAAATPVIPATSVAFTVVADHVGGVRIDHLTQAKGGGALSNLTAACALRGNVGPKAQSEDEGEDDGDEDEGEGEDEDEDQDDGDEDAGEDEDDSGDDSDDEV